jgi:heme-degrading monooxygenase HmoA
MFVHLALHYPKPEHADDMLASMHRVDAAAQGAPGLIQIGAWRDAKSDRLIGLAMWESRDAWEAAVEGIFAAIENDPILDWSTQPPDSFHLTPA